MDQYLTELKKGETTTLGHLIAFMHTFNLRFGVAKTPVQEQTYDQLYPLLVAIRDQGKVPSANPFTTSSGAQDPKAVSAYFSGMQYDPKHGVVPPPPPAQPALMSGMKRPSTESLASCPVRPARGGAIAHTFSRAPNLARASRMSRVRFRRVR